MKIYFAISFLSFFCIEYIFGQTGPAGVGTSVTNILWLDANRGITLTGTSVTNWADQSGNAFNAVPSSVNARPTFVPNSVNSYPSIGFDGTDDELRIADNALLDLTQWHIFIVLVADLQKNYNAWLVKGNDVQENYEMLSYNDGNIHTPLSYTDATRTAPSSAGGQVTTTEFNIIEYSYSSTVGRDVYKNFASIHTDNDNKTPSTNNFELYIGNERSTAGRFINGDLAEVIMFNAPINVAQRIIVNNYLAAKYNKTLTANDLYDEDDVASGNYDHEVAGIGRIDASNIQSNSQGTGLVTVLNPVGLDDNEFYIWGHDNAPAVRSTVSLDYPAGEGLQGRFSRIWRGSETGNITSFDIRFNLAGLGPVTATDLRLLIDTDNDGIFSDETTAGGGVIAGATFVSGITYQFSGVTGLNNNLRFTIGTINIAQTPLPVELLNFEAVYKNDVVHAEWQTASETNNHFFTVEKSNDGKNFSVAGMIDGAGNSSTLKKYKFIDKYPFEGISYYRLKQTDFNGNFKYSKIVSINTAENDSKEIVVYPNPSKGIFHVENLNQKITVLNTLGQKILTAEINSNSSKIDLTEQPTGVYFIEYKLNNKIQYKKIVIQR
ncbi:MAG: T9SS type A sorting domain-containing protein [Raineya sp.]|jgi:hypothetical protein|nr:T9SS type A sorting domain-containing protein [Raineya sp.]